MGFFLSVLGGGVGSRFVSLCFKYLFVDDWTVDQIMNLQFSTYSLQDLVSYRHVNVCQEQHLVEEIKLQTLHVVDDYILALQKAREVRLTRCCWVMIFFWKIRVHNACLVTSGIVSKCRTITIVPSSTPCQCQYI